MNLIARAIAVQFCIIGCASAQPAPAPEVAAPPVVTPPVVAPTTAPANASVDATLDALDRLGKSMTDFSADVTSTTIDGMTGNETSLGGKVFYAVRPGGDARIRVVFDTKTVGDQRYDDEKVEYLLDGGALVSRNYRDKVEVRRQVLKPGEKSNLLKLGEGPFPLPIGQDKAEVHRLFDVAAIPPAEGDPAGSAHLRLVPRADTQFATKFKSLDVWVDPATGFPVRIDSEDASDNATSTRRTELNAPKVNAGLADADFTLPPVEGWNLRTEQYAE